MNYSAIRHIANRYYCKAVDKDKFLFRVQCAIGDMEAVRMHYQDKNIPVEYLDTRQDALMTKVATDRHIDYYEIIIDMHVGCLRYYFEFTDCNGKVAYYGNGEFFDDDITDNDYMFNCTQTFKEEERHVIPDWAKNEIVYQIFVSRFATSQYVEEKMWYKSPIGFRDNLRGDLKGIIYELDYLRELGVDVVYMTPVFASGSSHKYDTDDYFRIDPSFGTIEDMRELVDKAHRLGMRVILDAVFNHTSTNFFAFADVMRKGFQSEYKDWYYIEGFPIDKGGMKRKPNYKTFSYYGGMPKVNLNNEEAAKYFTEVGCYWIRECDIDGWRLDVGDEISHVFWKRFKKAVREVKEDVLLIGEDWQFGNDYLDGDEWDSIMNYSFFRMMKGFVAEERITATEFLEKLGFVRGFFGPQIYPVLWNLFDSHDTARFRNMCGEDIRRLRLAAGVQLLLPGMPFIYYGDEQGMTGGNDPDCRRGMLWGEEYQDRDTYLWYKRLIELRKEYRCITEGTVTYAVGMDEERIIIIERELEGEGCVCVFNGSDSEHSLEQYKGRVNLITGQIFDGCIKEYEVLLLK